MCVCILINYFVKKDILTPDIKEQQLVMTDSDMNFFLLTKKKKYMSSLTAAFFTLYLKKMCGDVLCSL